jgi:hypothetical protein
MKNKINLKFNMLLMLLQLILITLNPLLVTIFDELYLRYIIKHTTFYLDDRYLPLDTFVNQLEAEVDDLFDAYTDEDDPKLASQLLIQWQNTINTLNSVAGANHENIIIEENDHNIQHELDANNSETENSDGDASSYTGSSTESDASTNSDSETDVNSSISDSIIPLPILLLYKNLLTNINKIKTNWNKLITTPIILDKVKIGRKKINLKIKILLILLQFILLTLNPLLTLTFFETFFIRMLLFNTRYSFLGPHAHLDEEEDINLLGWEDENWALTLTLQVQNILNHENNILGLNDNELIIDDNDSTVHNDAIQDAIDDETEAIAAEIEQEQLLHDLSDATGEPIEVLRDRLRAENSNTSFNHEEIIATSTPNTASHELDVNTNSNISESIIPFLLILIHQNLLTKFNKFKTKWIKLITTPIILGKLRRGRQSNILKYIKYLSIFLTFILLILLSLLFYPSSLENISLNYLLLILTNIFDYTANHLYGLYQYCVELYNIINFTENNKTITPDTKLIKDVNDNSDNNETIDNKDTTDSKPFYKSKLFIVCGIIIVSSTLLYLYNNNSLLYISEHNINSSDLTDKLLNIIKQKEDLINTLRSENIQLTDEKLRVVGNYASRMDIVYSILDS